MLARQIQPIEAVDSALRNRRWIPYAIVAVATAIVLGISPAWLISDESLKTLIALALLIGPLCVVLAVAKSHALPAKDIAFRLGLVIWWYLLISDALFDRISDVQGTYAGAYSVEAYGQGITWVAVLIALLLISFTAPGYLRELFSGPYKWASLFALSCLAAAAYSPSPAYSLGWWFKLAVILLTLRLCVSGMNTIDHIRNFLWASLLGLICAVLLPLSRAFSDPLTLFEGVGGRLNADPVVISVTSSCILIVALTLNALRRHLYLSLIVIGSVLVMFLSMGKTGIIAGVVSATVFFLFQRRIVSVLVLMVCVALVGAVVIATVTPVGYYFLNYNGAGTLTGRTEIWKMALPEILNKPIFGHGYLSTKFMWLNLTGPFAEVGHLHNGFLETLYNNGLVGLALLLTMHLAILGNLLFARRVMGAPAKGALGPSVMTVLVVGGFALYLDLLINGMFTVAFGGRPTVHFMMFLGVLGWSTALRVLATRVQNRILVTAPAAAPVSRPFSVPVAARPGTMRNPSLG